MRRLYSYCSGCGRRIEVRDICFEATDSMPLPNEYENLCFCVHCFQKTDTGEKVRRCIVYGEDSPNVDLQ